MRWTRTTAQRHLRVVASLFGPLLRGLRVRRGVSQLELALAAEVSNRHLSYLETGRARPSEGMALRLSSALALTPHEENELVTAAGFGAPHPASPELPSDAAAVLDDMMAKHEPYPLLVLDAGYTILGASRGAQRLVAHAGAPMGPNLLVALFEPAALRPHIRNWPTLAARLLVRLRREALSSPHDPRPAALLTRLLAMPDVPRGDIDVATPPGAVVPLELQVGEHALSFVATTTTFSVPHDLRAADVRIESLFPRDPATRRWLEADPGGSRRGVPPSRPT